MSDPTKTLMSPAEQAAHAKKLEAEAVKAEAEARKFIGEAREAEASARTAEIVLQLAEEADAAKRAGDDYHRVYRFTGGVDGGTVASAMKKLTEWDRLYPAEPFEIIFFSPGGAVIPGMALFDFIRDLSANGHEITTGCTGMAASMGGILVQAGDKRWASHQSWYLIHRAAFAAAGKTFDVEDEVEFVKRIEKRIIDIFVSRSHLTVAKIRRKWDRKDWWLDADEMLKEGLIDEIRPHALSEA